MLTTDVHSIVPLDRSAYRDDELITIISQQLFAGNYTNNKLLINIFCSPQFKINSQRDYRLAKSINLLSAQCEQKSAEGCSHAMGLFGLLYYLGIGCERNYREAILLLDKAIELYDKASQLGDTCAMFGRAMIYQQQFEQEAGVEPTRFYEYNVEIIRLYEDIIRQDPSNLNPYYLFAEEDLKRIIIDDKMARLLLDLIWDKLVAGQSFSERTLAALREFCKEDIVDRLKACTSFAFFKQLKTNPQHPLTLILNEGEKENNAFLSLMEDARSQRDQRITFFYSKSIKERFPDEITRAILYLAHPGMELDDQKFIMKFEYEEIIRRLKQNDSTLTALNLRQKGLTSKESQQFFKALEENTIVTKLQYVGNNSSGDAAKALSEMLQKNQTIEELELGTNELNNEDVRQIANGLKQNSSVVLLDLNSNLFNSAEPIADLLKHNNYIKEIELTNSKIDNAGFLKIYEALQENKYSSLTTFSVYFPRIDCMDDFDNVCRANASRVEGGVRPF